MSTNYKIEVPAKINIGLKVGKRRKDGFHDIMSIYQRISLYDKIEMTFEKAEETFCEVTGLETICAKNKDTMTIAVNRWSLITGIKVKANIKIEKGIPPQSGLGGESSDAAGVLLKLEEWANFPSEPSLLCKIALEVGCDVPFFLSGLSSAYICGIGEIIRPVKTYDNIDGYVLIPDELKVSTFEAYKQLDSRENVVLPTEAYFLNRYNSGFNSLIIENDFEYINSKPKLSSENDAKIWLTGSGSAWFYANNIPPKKFIGKILPVSFI